MLLVSNGEGITVTTIIMYSCNLKGTFQNSYGCEIETYWTFSQNGNLAYSDNSLSVQRMKMFFFVMSCFVQYN